jgi:hypothetical protein
MIEFRTITQIREHFRNPLTRVMLLNNYKIIVDYNSITHKYQIMEINKDV